MLIKTGDWEKLARVIDPAKLSMAIQKHGLLASKKVGLTLERSIRKEIRRVSSPSNSPITIARKGSSNPLQDEGQLMSAVTHIVLAPLIVWVGIPKGIKHPESGTSLALIAEVLNGGTFGRPPKDTIIVPTRSKALFIPLRKDVEPNQAGLVRGEDFILAKSVRIRPRPFLSGGYKKAEGKIVKIYEAATIAAFRSLMRG